MHPTALALALLVAQPPAPDENEERLWQFLADASAEKFHQIVPELIGDPEPTVALLAEKLRPVPPPDMEMVRDHADALGDPDYRTRERAFAALRRVGRPASSVLQEILKDPPSLEAETRALRLVAWVRNRPMNGARLRSVRGVELLERIGGPEAQAVLDRLADVQ